MTMTTSPDPWRDDAACRTADPTVFFPTARPGPGVDHDYEDRVATARSYCAVCPVIDECLEDALSRGQQDGVWGGLTEDERTRYRRARIRGRHQTARSILATARGTTISAAS